MAETLAREVCEEACAQVDACQYIGCQRIEDLSHPAGPQVYYQTRMWARVSLEPFAPQVEKIARHLVTPAQFLQTLSWGHVPIAKVILDAGLAIENSINLMR